MVIDHFIQAGLTLNGSTLERSKKFVLSGAFVETCAEFVEEETFMETMRQMARLPFGSEYHVFELQRPRYTVDTESDVVTLICNEIKIDEKKHIQVHYFVGTHLFPYVTLFSPEEMERCDDGQILIPFRVMTTKGEKVPFGKLSPNAEHRILAGSVTISSILAVLNSPKIIETEEINNDAWNIKRKKHGQKLLHNHTFVTIKREIREAVLKQNEGLPEEFDSVGKRIHWRRGHFKHRATGTFWWSATLVGSGIAPEDKRYEVTA